MLFIQSSSETSHLSKVRLPELSCLVFFAFSLFMPFILLLLLFFCLFHQRVFFFCGKSLVAACSVLPLCRVSLREAVIVAAQRQELPAVVLPVLRPVLFPEAASVVLVTSAGAPRGAGKATLPLFTRLSYLKGLGFPFVGQFSFPRFVELAPKSPSPNGRHPWFCSEPFDLHPLRA